jgi:hypothetical protein
MTASSTRQRTLALVAVLVCTVAAVAVIVLASRHTKSAPRAKSPSGTHAKKVPPASRTVSPEPAAKLPPGAPCTTRPSACGYPDRSNTGVPPGTTLKPSGSIEVDTPGTVIAGLDVHGTIRISADNVTIKDTQVTESWPTGPAVYILPKVRGTVIEDSTIRGRDGAANAVEYAILNAGWGPNVSTRALRVQLYNCTECYAGPGTIQDSYLNVSAVVDGAHYEDIYYGGGAGPLIVEHNTLLNPQPQTAAVFTKTDFGPVTGTRIDGNLLAGGGWTIYGGGDSASDIRVTNNRFSTVYHPKVGYFGVAAAINYRSTTWAGNYMDGTLKPVAP